MKNGMMRYFRKTFGKVVAVLLMLMMPGAAVAQEAVHIPGFYGNSASLPVIPSTALPAGGVVSSGGANFENRYDSSSSHPHQLFVHQETENVIIDWESFNIGREAWTHFDQQGNADWKALNRIYDQSPSQIYGRLTADGKIYLINQNGILFAPGSQVDVHSLVASALNITADDFLADRLQFSSDEPGFAETFGVVANHGTITAETGGSVFLIGDLVENSGSVSADFGQAGLIGAEEVEIGFTSQSVSSYKDVMLSRGPGQAVNLEGGLLAADQGLAGMYGQEVDQNGIIRSVTALRGSGKIQLIATQRITTGENSVTATPISTSTETILGAEFNGGQIELEISGGDGEAESVIEHDGIIAAPSGEVRLNADDRIYLGETSTIDVSGSWSNLVSDRNLVTAQLNSQELKDDFDQKNSILQGEEIQFNRLLGSAIGDVSGNILTVENTALDQSTSGGDIYLSVGNGDIILREGGTLDFSGGASIYGSGSIDSTMLLVGNSVYDISNAPQHLRYEAIMNDQSWLNTRYGISETFQGVYAGGANPISDYSQSYAEGDDAGTLNLVARHIVLDGRLAGQAYYGPYQTETELLLNKSGSLANIGNMKPVGGKLIIGNRSALNLADDNQRDFGLGDVRIEQNVEALPSSFTVSDAVPAETYASTYSDATGRNLLQTRLDAQQLSESGLSTLQIYANSSITIASDADLRLTSGGWQSGWYDERDSGVSDLVGSFSAYARTIVNEGSVTVPSGSIAFYSTNNITGSPLLPNSSAANSRHVDLDEGILLAPGSALTVAGEQVDNSNLDVRASQWVPSVHTDGGQIILKSDFAGDKQDFVWVAEGAVVDVSGGYEVGLEGDISAGDAGLLSIEAGAMALEGQLKGFAVEGQESGQLTIKANRITIATEGLSLPDNYQFGDPLPETIAEQLVVDDDMLADTGFTQLTIYSHWDIDVSPGTLVRPSNQKMTVPTGVSSEIQSRWQDTVIAPGYGTTSARSIAGGDRVAVLEEDIGPSSVVLVAGQDRLSAESNEQNDSALVTIHEGAVIQMAPAGSIEAEAPQVIIGGSLQAPAGSIQATSKNYDLIVQSSAELRVPGYNLLAGETVVPGLPLNRSALDAGSILLRSATTDTYIEPGALIDVSGSEAVLQTLVNADGTLVRSLIASNAGQLEIRFTGLLNPEYGGSGQITGSGSLEAVRILAAAASSGSAGGELSIVSDNEEVGLSLTPEFVSGFQSAGFDALNYQSLHSIIFNEPLTLTAGRSITLNAPVMSAQGSGDVIVRAPWLTLQNTYSRAGIAAPQMGNVSLWLDGTWIDLAGNTVLDGFSDVTLQAASDIRLIEQRISGPGGSRWAGSFHTPSPLTLQAERIYPTTLSEFTIASGNLQSDGTYTEGLITILSGGRSDVGTIYSAGGHVRLLAETIFHEGILAAPLGIIELGNSTDDSGSSSTDRIYLAEGSLLSTAGSALVNYGTLDDIFWTTNRGTTNDPDVVVSLPENSIRMAGQEIIQREDARIDFSAGGGIFAYEFLSSIEGSENPLSGSYVILPDRDYDIPGAVLEIVDGTSALPAGRYTILPEAYAFLPGAMVVKASEGTRVDVLGASNQSDQGNALVTARLSETGFSGQGGELALFEVRSAGSVLGEGFFNTIRLDANNAGTLRVRGNTTLLDGMVAGHAVNGGTGAIVDLVGAHITVAAENIGLPDGFQEGSDVPLDLVGRLYLSSSFFENGGIDTVYLGDTGQTDAIRLAADSQIQSRNIHLAAAESIHLESGASLTATEGGQISLRSPLGLVRIDSDATVQSEDITIETGELALDGLLAGNGRLALESTRIYLTDNGIPDGQPAGLLLDTDVIAQMNTFQTLELVSASDVVFVGAIQLSSAGDLKIDAARFAGLGHDGSGVDVSLQAATVSLWNSRNESLDASLADTGTILIDADRIEIGSGAIRLDGFDQARFESLNDTVFIGEGSLTAEAATHFTAGSLSASPQTQFDSTGNRQYSTARFTVDVGTRTIQTFRSSGAPAGNMAPDGDPGGSLTFLADSIQHDGVIRIGSGSVSMTATGTDPDDGVFLGAEAVINTQGRRYDYQIGDAIYSTILPGGRIDLQADAGAVTISEGAILDVSQGASQADAEALGFDQTSGFLDAGHIRLAALGGDVTLDGILMGSSAAGTGGSMTLFTGAIDDLGQLLMQLDASGFNGDLDLHARTGDYTIAAAQTVTARNFSLVTDSGNIDLAGTIDTSGENGGGQVVLFAGGDHIGLLSGSRLLAAGTAEGADGGEVVIGVSNPDGWINPDAGQQAFIDVSAGENGQGGRIWLRAPRSGDNSDINSNLGGVLQGAENVVVEGYRVYMDGTITSSDINGTMRSEATLLADSGDAIAARLQAGGLTFQDMSTDGLLVVPGVEIQSLDSLSLNSNWNLTNWITGGRPGVLTLRAADNLSINAELADHPHQFYEEAQQLPGMDTWAINLVAGADLTGADLWGTVTGHGDIIIDDRETVYTESAPIRFSSGNDVVIGEHRSTDMPFYMAPELTRYAIGSYNGDIQGQVGGSLLIGQRAAIQTASGDIKLTVGGNMELESYAAVRTTGELALVYSFSDYSSAANGGNITLHVGGQLTMEDNPLAAWDTVYTDFLDPDADYWAASYEYTGANEIAAGLITMGGGDLTIRTGSHFDAPVGAFKTGNLSLLSGGNIDGRFLVYDGVGTIHAMGDIGTARPDQSLELFAATINMTAQGSIHLGTISNTVMYHATSVGRSQWDLQYSVNSAVSLQALDGDLALTGQNRHIEGSDTQGKERVLPPNVSLVASNDIRIQNNFYMAPAADGNLVMNAGGNIDGLYQGAFGDLFGQILMSDLEPSAVYGDHPGGVINTRFINPLTHGATLLHEGDAVPVSISADGSIQNINLFLAKQAQITAGSDIANVYYGGQNISPDDITLIQAGGSIVMRSAAALDQPFTGFQHGGPGTLLVQAGERIDLGTTDGIRTIGNLVNFALSDEGSDLYLLSGTGREVQTSAFVEFFEQLRKYGETFSSMMAGGDVGGAMAVVEQAREAVIDPFFGEEPIGGGDIDMVRSSIATQKGGDIFMVSTGSINVGGSTFLSEAERENTGINTQAGGSINIYTEADLNVNESRVMSWLGGDITSWANQGDINAGRGSTTEVSASAPTRTVTYAIDETTGQILLDDDGNPIVESVSVSRETAAVGSGIRTLTFDPDGVAGPEAAPTPGDLYLFAPEGVIDAGEAGIAGRNIVLGATEVLNAQNISFSQGSVGVPVSSDTSINVGALGATSLTETNNMSENTAAMAAARSQVDQAAGSLAESFIPKWLKVEVIGFE